MKPSNGDRYDKCSDFAGNHVLSAFLLNTFISAGASCSFLYHISSSIAQSMDSGGTDNFILISQLKEEVMSLKRLLQQRDQTILDKDRKVGALTLESKPHHCQPRVLVKHAVIFLNSPPAHGAQSRLPVPGV